MNHPMRNFTLLAVLCGVVISGAHVATRDGIDANRLQYSLKQQQELVGDTRENIIPLQEDLYYTERDGGLTGFIHAGSTREGYNGLIRVWVAITPDSRIRGMRVTEHRETPGIGDAIDIHVSPWINQIRDSSERRKTVGTRFALKQDGGDIDQITGATITSRAMVRLAETVTQEGRLHMQEWISRIPAGLLPAPADSGEHRTDPDHTGLTHPGILSEKGESSFQ